VGGNEKGSAEAVVSSECSKIYFRNQDLAVSEGGLDGNVILELDTKKQIKRRSDETKLQKSLGKN